MYGQQPRIQQVCALLTFGADVCTPHPSLELWFGVRVQAPMSPARSTPPQQGMWGQPPRTQQVHPPRPLGCRTIHHLACLVSGTIVCQLRSGFDTATAGLGTAARHIRAPHSSLPPGPEPYTFNSQPQTLTTILAWLE